ncbi:MAG: efflux RND transporter periplasmic adaptor subunit [Thermoguttaceae bacterium]
MPVQAQQMPPALVKVALVQQANPTVGQTFVGTVMPVRSSTVGSTVEGRVVELAVDEGDAVTAGDVLARLRTDQLQIQLAAAEAELQLHKHSRDELDISIPEEIRQAEARVEATAALVKFAQLQLKHARTLLQRNATSEDDVQEKESIAVAAQQKYLENGSALRLAKEAAPAKRAQAEARWQAQLEETRRLKDQIAEHTILAPFDGFVTKEHTEVGQWIAKGGAVVDVVEIHQVDVEVSVPEKYISRIRLGAEARVTIESMSGSSETLPLGKVTAIVPQADVRSRTFPVKVRLDNRPVQGGMLLMPGMFARVHLDLDFGAGGSGIWVPKDAVVLGQGSSTVFIVVEGKAMPVPVQLLRYVGDLVEVRGEIRPGQQVVVEGNERLMPGQPVSVVGEDGASAAPPAKVPSE